MKVFLKYLTIPVEFSAVPLRSVLCSPYFALLFPRLFQLLLLCTPFIHLGGRLEAEPACDFKAKFAAFSTKSSTHVK